MRDEKFKKLEHKKYKAILFMLLSGLGYALMNISVKLSGDIPPLEKVLFRNIVCAVIAAILILKTNGTFIGIKKNRKFLMGRAIIGTFGTWCNFYAIDHLMVADASMLNQMSPFFVMIFCFIFLKEKLKPVHIICILVALFGVWLISEPKFNSTFIPYLSGIFCAIFDAAAYTFIRAMKSGEHDYTIVFVFSTTAVIMTFPFVIFQFKMFNLQELFWLLLTGVFAAIGQFALTFAYEAVAAKEVSIFGYSQVIFTAIIGFFLFGNIPNDIAIVGYILILLAAFFIFLVDKKEVKDKLIKD